MMHHVPQPGLTVPAVAGPVERGVRPRSHPATLGFALLARRLGDSKTLTGGAPTALRALPCERARLSAVAGAERFIALQVS